MYKGKNSEVKDDWRYNMLILIMKQHGLYAVYFKDGASKKVMLSIRIFLLVLQGFHFCHSLAGVFIHLTQETQIKLAVIVSYATWACYASLCAFRNYALLKHKPDILYMLQKSRQNELLSVERIPWRRYSSVFAVFWFSYLLLVDGVVLAATFVRPFVRFVVKKEHPTAFIRSLWYPPWLFTSPILCWCAFIYEWLVVIDTRVAIALPDLLFVYFTMTIVVKLEALGNFFASNFGEKSNETTNMDLLRSFKETAYSKDQRFIESKLEEFKRGILYWHILRRDSNLINGIYSTAASSIVIIIVASNTSMIYLAITELRHFGLNVSSVVRSLHFFLEAFVGAYIMYVTSYCSTLLQQAHENFRQSLWRYHWFSENLQFKKLFFCFNVPLSEFPQITALRIQPYNLQNFFQNQYLVYSYVSFLLELKAKSL